MIKIQIKDKRFIKFDDHQIKDFFVGYQKGRNSFGLQVVQGYWVNTAAFLRGQYKKLLHLSTKEEELVKLHIEHQKLSRLLASWDGESEFISNHFETLCAETLCDNLEDVEAQISNLKNDL